MRNMSLVHNWYFIPRRFIMKKIILLWYMGSHNGRLGVVE